jgi:hypothetical protein
MVEIPDLGVDFHRMWEELIRLGEDPPAPWTLIGAHMVALHGWVRGQRQIRPSKDADLLVNVRTVADGIERISHALRARGYVLEGISPEGIGHRFIKEGVSVDILAPDGLSEKVKLLTVGGARTIGVPGGTQALKRSVQIEVRTRSTSGLVPVPNLLGALLVKVRAIQVDDQPEAQRRDTAFLLSLVDDPDTFADDLSRTERQWLRRHPYLADALDGCYRGIPRAEDAAIVFRRLAGF